jgi:aspartyl-tRNA(Asn)/glutamyl-tRNA(Gln) amidotransferase subunit B
MRSKEEAHDYRYFPDPDLLPLEVDDAYIALLAQDLPELPDEKRARFGRDFGLSAYDADVLVADRETANFFESVAHGRDGKQAVNWVINELLGALNRAGKSIETSPISAHQLGELLDLQKEGVVSGKIAKEVFEILFSEGGSPREIVDSRGLKQVTDSGAIETIIDEVIANNPEKVAQIAAKPAMLGWFVGQVMKATGGKANPQSVNALLKARLEIEVGPGFCSTPGRLSPL